MTSIAELRKKNQNALEKFQKTMEQDSKGQGQGDPRFWKPFFDKEKGHGSAEIRFMPAPPGEDYPWVKLYSHGFKGPTGKWYVENSLTSLPGKNPDPCGELNNRLWNSGVESDKDVARNQKRRLSYYTNVLVVNDPAAPENNGKVFLYRFGPKIYEMLEEAMNPDTEVDPDAKAVNPFDPWEGANFVIKMKGHQLGKNIVPNYDKSYFKSPAEMGDDDEIEELWKGCHSLQELVSEKNFKTYEELQKRLFEVLGETAGSGVPVVEGWQSQKPAPQSGNPAPKDDSDDIPFDMGESKAKEPENDMPAPTPENPDDDDDMAFFQRMADGE